VLTDWRQTERRFLLPLIGVALGIAGYLATVRPATADASLSAGYNAIWSGQPGRGAYPIFDALRLDPGSPERWSDMAEAMHATGRDDQTQYCLQQELLSAPHLPHVAMRAAGMYFRLGNRAEALQLTHRVVEETEDYDANVFQAWQRLGGTATDVYGLGVGSNARAGKGYFRFLLNSSDDDPSIGAAWAELQSRGMAGVDEARFYAASLTAAHDFERAANIESAVLPEGVWNGGFEKDWTGEGLDWHVQSARGVLVSRDTAVRHSGAASLRMEFDGSSRDEFSFVSETRSLPAGSPKSRWKLRAMLRTEIKASELGGLVSGVGIRVVDPENGNILGRSAMVKASQEWTRVEVTLDAAPRARPVRIEILHPTTEPTEYSMTGTAWVDDVTLTAEAAR